MPLGLFNNDYVIVLWARDAPKAFERTYINNLSFYHRMNCLGAKKQFLISHFMNKVCVWVNFEPYERIRTTCHRDLIPTMNRHSNMSTEMTTR